MVRKETGFFIYRNPGVKVFFKKKSENFSDWIFFISLFLKRRISCFGLEV